MISRSDNESEIYLNEKYNCEKLFYKTMLSTTDKMGIRYLSKAWENKQDSNRYGIEQPSVF